jgi:broad specificity phosphatase PhoE
MASLLLLRHGQIEANRKGLWHGSTNSPMTWRGRRQAKQTARYLAAAHGDLAAIYTSPLDRCLQTAKAVQAQLDIEPTPVTDLAEYAIGEWEGLAFDLLAETHDFYDRSRADMDFSPPGGESLATVSQRVVAALQSIQEQHGAEDRVLVVGHGVAFAVALGSILDGDPGRWVEYPVANCSLTELVLSPAPYVNFFNSTQHL